MWCRRLLFGEKKAAAGYIENVISKAMAMGGIKRPRRRLQLDSTFLTPSAKRTEEQFGLRMREQIISQAALLVPAPGAELLLYMLFLW